MKKSDITHSKFWLGDQIDDLLTVDSDVDLFRLSSMRRAISNFVFILTGQNIPVRFAERKTSWTNKKVVSIGGELTKGEFDSTVGLACHESCHILFPEYFDLVRLMWSRIPDSIYKIADGKLSKNAIATFAKNLFNWIEDRYIDDHAWRAAPGYRGYYIALYSRYFNHPKLTKLIESNKFRECNLQSYDFRIINLVSPASDLDALPKLKEIYNLIDVPNISRLSVPVDRLNLAISVLEIVVKEIVDQNTDQQPDGTEDDDGEGGKDESKDDSSQKKTPEEQKADEEKTESTKEKLEGEGEKKPGPNDDISEKNLEDALKEYEKQKSFLDGEVKKTMFDEKMVQRLSILEDSDISVVSVGGSDGVPKVDCIVVRRLTHQLMSSPDFPYSRQFRSRGIRSLGIPRPSLVSSSTEMMTYEAAENGVRDGIRLGSQLGRKLQIRRDSKITVNTRLEVGRLDERLLSELAFGNGNIFYQTSTSQYKKVHLHLTVDASGSMESKWQKTICTSVAIAKAASMVNNIDVTISFRSGVGFDSDRGKVRPYVLIAYDSRRDKFSKITQLFPYLCASGSTPEGLAFEAILDEIPRPDDTLDSYFLNISDGEPAFTTHSDVFAATGIEYAEQIAYKHTKRQVDKIRQSGVEVLSYFLEETLFLDSPRVKRNMLAFKQMYGSDAKLIDVESVTQIANTMNIKFLRKSEVG